MATNTQIIRDFLKDWANLDAVRLASYFADDGVYHNMPGPPVAGRAQIQSYIAAFSKDWTATDWEIVTLIEAGDVVVAERLDRTQIGAKRVDLPCCGVFEMQAGKIKVWRDYFDRATYTRALTE